MRKSGYLAAGSVVCLVSAGCGWGETPVRDESGFREFSYTQMPALGFCPSTEGVFGASITLQDDGSYVLAVSVVTGQEDSNGDCDEGSVVVLGACLQVEALPARSLSTSEAEQVLDAFREIKMVTTTFSGAICIDPCVIPVFAWDEFSTTPTPAGCITEPVELLDAATADHILAVLETLRNGA